jgi:hypothetical protein
MDEGIAAGARARQLALLLGIGLTRCSDAVERKIAGGKCIHHPFIMARLEPCTLSKAEQFTTPLRSVTAGRPWPARSQVPRGAARSCVTAFEAGALDIGPAGPNPACLT